MKDSNDMSDNYRCSCCLLHNCLWSQSSMCSAATNLFASASLAGSSALPAVALCSLALRSSR
eukprot:13606-Heterococcus_DN1.PRE.1